jgi:outer membrane protein
MKMLKSAVATALLVAASAAVSAQDLKIGYINAERVLRESVPAKAALAKLEAEFGKRERELVEAANRLKAAGDKLEKELPTLSEAERNRRQRDIVEQERDHQRKRREYQEDLNQRRNEEHQAILERANRVVRQIFEQEKFDMILQEAIVDPKGPLVSARVDITKKVMDALNAGK